MYLFYVPRSPEARRENLALLLQMICPYKCPNHLLGCCLNRESLIFRKKTRQSSIRWGAVNPLSDPAGFIAGGKCPAFFLSSLVHYAHTLSPVFIKLCTCLALSFTIALFCVHVISRQCHLCLQLAPLAITTRANYSNLINNILLRYLGYIFLIDEVLYE